MKKINKPHLYYFHEESDSFFLAEIGWESQIDCVKIGLTTKPGINNLIRKITKRFGDDSWLMKHAMDLYDFDEETWVFISIHELSDEEIRRGKI